MSRLGSLNQISEINEHLYLSGSSPLRPDRIRAKKITCIVNATIDEPTMYLPGIDYLKIRIDDNPLAHLDAYFDMVADRVRGTKEKGGKTLVHCVAGVSRSASLVIAYLMKHENMILRQAYHYVKAMRPIIRPNCGFWRQLIDFEKSLYGKTSVKMVLSKWNELVPDVYAEEIKSTWMPLKVMNRSMPTVIIPSASSHSRSSSLMSQSMPPPVPGSLPLSVHVVVKRRNSVSNNHQNHATSGGRHSSIGAPSTAMKLRSANFLSSLLAYNSGALSRNEELLVPKF